MTHPTLHLHLWMEMMSWTVSLQTMNSTFTGLQIMLSRVYNSNAIFHVSLIVLYEDFKSLRALMSCGHAVTPMSLTNWCLSLLNQVGYYTFIYSQTPNKLTVIFELSVYYYALSCITTELQSQNKAPIQHHRTIRQN